MKRSFCLVKFKSLLFSFLLFPFALWSQSKVYHETFTTRDGIAIDNIEDILQDDSGFLWIVGSRLDNREIIGKSNPISIQRFDGKNFHNIKIVEDGSRLDISKMIRFQDSLILLYTFQNDEKTLFHLNTTNGESKSSKVLGFENFSNVRFLNNNYYLLNAKGTTIELYRYNEENTWDILFSFENDVNILDLDRNTSLIALNDYFIFGDKNFPITIIDTSGQVIKKYSSEPYNRSRDLISNKLWIEESFVLNDHLYAFMNNDDRLHKFNNKSLEFEPINDQYFKGKTALKIFKDSLENLVIAFTQDNNLKLVTLDENEKIKPIYSHEVEDSNAIQIWSQNLKKELWIGTGGELHYYKFPINQFEKFLIDKQLRTLKRIDNENYIVATERSGWFNYNHDNKSLDYFPIYENDQEIKLSSSRNIFINNDTLWSHTSGSIVAVHKENGGSRSYRHFPIQSLEMLNDSIIVFGTNRYNLMSFNIRNHQFISLARTDTLQHIDLALDDQRKWIVTATQKGVFTYNLKSKNTHLERTSLADNYFLVADYHKDYGFLLGTRDGKIIQYEPLGNSYSLIYEDDLNAGIATITPFENDLWINTFNGLVNFKPTTKSKTRYSIRDGLSHNEGNRYSASLTSNGILIGNIKGLNHFIPQELVEQQSIDTLSLLKIRKFDPAVNSFVDNYDRHAFAKANTITLPVENKQLELEYSLTGLNVLRNESYEYRLNDDSWVSLGDNKKLQFLNLASGDYNLEIRAKDFSGKVIGESLHLKIESQEFFYKKWWFFALIIALVTLVLSWFIKQEKLKQLMQVKFSQDLIQNQENERSRIAKELHDSVGQQLTLIKQKAQSNHFDGITELTNSTLEEVRSISRNLYPVIIKQLGLTGAVEHLLLQIDEETDLFVSVMLDDIDHLFSKDQAVNIYRFIQECIANVLKHAQATTLEVIIEKESKTVTVVIRDNGKGFDALKMHEQNSLGLKTLKERLRILDGDLNIQSSLNQGTVTIATIPLKS